MTMTTTKLRINSLTELQVERLNLRSKVIDVESDLRVHYNEIVERVQPVTKIFGAVSKFNNLIGIGGKKSDPDNSGSNSYLSTTAKVALPLIAGGILFAGRKRIILKSLIWYGLGQATEYVVSKNMSEHIASVKNVFSSKEDGSGTKGIF